MEKDLTEEELIRINKGLEENRIHPKGFRVITYVKENKDDYHSINDLNTSAFSFESPSSPYEPGFGNFTDLVVNNQVKINFGVPSIENNSTNFTYESTSYANTTSFSMDTPSKEVVVFNPNIIASADYEVLYGNPDEIALEKGENLGDFEKPDVGKKDELNNEELTFDNPEVDFQGYFAETALSKLDSFQNDTLGKLEVSEVDPFLDVNYIKFNMFPDEKHKSTWDNWVNAIGKDQTPVYNYFYNMLSINKDLPSNAFYDSPTLQFTPAPSENLWNATATQLSSSGGLNVSESDYVSYWIDNNEKELKKRFKTLHPELEEDSEEYKTAWEAYVKEQEKIAKEAYKAIVEERKQQKWEVFNKAHEKWWNDNFSWDGENSIWKQSLNSFTAGLINMGNEYVSDLINGILGKKGKKGAGDIQLRGSAGTVIDLLTEMGKIPLYKEGNLYKFEDFKGTNNAFQSKKIVSSLRILFNKQLGIKNDSEAFIKMMNDDPLLSSAQFLLWTYKESNPGVIDKVYGFRLQGITIPEFSRKSQNTKYGFNILQLQAQENITVKNYADGEILCDKRLNSLRYLFDYLGIGVDEGASCPFVKDTFKHVNQDDPYEDPVSNEIFNLSEIHDITLNVPKENRHPAKDIGWLEADAGDMNRDLGELGTTAVLEIIPGSYIQREHNEIFGDRWNVHQPIEGMGKGMGQNDFEYQRTPYFVFENFRIYKASPQFNFRAGTDASLMKVKIGFSWTKMSINYRVFNGDIYAGKFGKDVNPELIWVNKDLVLSSEIKSGNF